MTNSLGTRYVYDPKVFESSHIKPLYKLGYRARVEDINSIYTKEYVYVKSASAINLKYTAGEVHGGMSLLALGSIGPSVSHAMILVPQFDMLIGEYGFALFEGEGKAYVWNGANASNINDYVKADEDNPAELVVTGNTLTASSMGIALEAIGGNQQKLIDVLLMGRYSKIST